MPSDPVLSRIIGQKPKEIEVDGEKILLRMLSADELFAFSEFQSSSPKPSSSSIMAKLVGYALAAEDGSRALSDEIAAAELPKVPAGRLAEIFHAAIAHSRISKDDAEQAEKN